MVEPSETTRNACGSVTRADGANERTQATRERSLIASLRTSTGELLVTSGAFAGLDATMTGMRTYVG